MADEELQQLEEELNELEQAKSDYGSPSPEKKDNMFKFFREILSLEETWKVGNLDDTEIGKIDLSVRSNLDIALYLEKKGLHKIAEYFQQSADVVAAPTMGRKGFMAQLFVTQIKRDQKVGTPAKKKGWIFGGKQNDEQGTAEQ
jgi:hypothetical protein